MAALTEEQRTGALVVFLVAALVFEEDRENDVWWYRWCVDHCTLAEDAGDLLLASVWWAMRFLRDDRDGTSERPEDWLRYIAHDYAQRVRYHRDREAWQQKVRAARSGPLHTSLQDKRREARARRT